MPKLIDIELEKIVIAKGVRKTFDDEVIAELSASFAKHGVLQPILVQPQDDGNYRLLVGKRRLRAAERAGLKTILALVLDEPLKPNEVLEAQLIENLHREDLTPIEEAEAYLALREMGYKVSVVARRVGKSRPYVSKRLRLLRLHPKLREAVLRRTLTPGHGQWLLKLEPEQQLALADEIVKKDLSVKETRQRVREMLGKEFEWRLVPVRLALDTYEALQRIAPEGDVKRLIQETVKKLVEKD